MPLFDGNDFHCGRDRRKDGIEISYTMRRELDGSINGVDDPTKNDVVHGMQKGPLDATSTVLVALNEAKKIINIHVPILERTL